MALKTLFGKSNNLWFFCIYVEKNLFFARGQKNVKEQSDFFGEKHNRFGFDFFLKMFLVKMRASHF